MQTPTEFQLKHLLGAYDPQKAHEYYLRTRKLKGRQNGSKPEANAEVSKMGNLRDPRIGKTREQIHQGAKTRQKQELTERVGRLEDKLKKLLTKIREMEHKEASEDRKGKAQKERAAKEKDKPKTAAEKAEASRENEKYRDKHKQELKSKAKEASKKSGGDAKKKSGDKANVADYKALATKVKGQIAVAKQKLAAL